MATAAPKRGLLGRMMLRKTVAQVQRETETSELKRSLGPWNLVFLGIGCIIGAGIFVRTGNAAALHAGPAVLHLLHHRRHRLRLRRPLLCRAVPRRFRCRARPTPTATRPSASSPPGSWARCCCSNTASPHRWSRSAGRAIWSACSATWACTSRRAHRAGGLSEGAGGRLDGITTVFNLPAFLVCAAAGRCCWCVGVSESAKVNNVIVAIKVTVLVAFILVGGFIILQNLRAFTPNWDPFIPEPTGQEGRVRLERNPPRRLDRLLRLHRLRGGLDRRPGSQGPEARTCRSGSSARWSPARSSTSWCRSS